MTTIEIFVARLNYVLKQNEFGHMTKCEVIPDQYAYLFIKLYNQPEPLILHILSMSSINKIDLFDVVIMDEKDNHIERHLISRADHLICLFR